MCPLGPGTVNIARIRPRVCFSVVIAELFHGLPLMILAQHRRTLQQYSPLQGSQVLSFLLVDIKPRAFLRLEP